MGSIICEVELCGALSVRWSYGKLCGVQLWGAQSVWWSYGELCGVELWGALVLEVIIGGEFDKKVFGLASLLCSHRIFIWRMVSWFYEILVS